MADIKNLQDKIRSTIYPNGKGAIQATAHQELLLNMAEGIQEADAKVTELSAEVSEVSNIINGKPQETLQWSSTNGFYPISATSEGDVIQEFYIYPNDIYRTMLLDCKEGDAFLVTIRCSQSPFCFVDKDNKLLAPKGVAGTRYIDYTLVAPKNAVKVIIQTTYAEWVELGSILPIKIGSTGIKEEINKKQNTISDLETIRRGAALGATAIQKIKTINGESIEGEGNITIEVGGDSYDDTEIRQQVTELSNMVNGKPQETLEWQSEGYIAINSSVAEGAIVDINVQPQASYRCLMVECEQGDTFLYTGRNGSFRPFAFLDAEYRLLPNYGVFGTKYKNEQITAPKGSAYLVLQTIYAEWVELGSLPSVRLGNKGLVESAEQVNDAVLVTPNVRTADESVQAFANLGVKCMKLNNVFSYGNFADSSVWSARASTSVAFANGIAKLSVSGTDSAIGIATTKASEINVPSNSKVFFAIRIRTNQENVLFGVKINGTTFQEIDNDVTINKNSDWEWRVIEWIPTSAYAASYLVLQAARQQAHMTADAWVEMKDFIVGIYGADDEMTADKFVTLLRPQEWFLGSIVIPNAEMLIALDSQLMNDIVVSVGESGNFPNLNTAIQYLSQFYPMYKYGGIKAEIRILRNTIIKDQVLVVGADYSWMTITYEGYNPDSLTYDNVAESIANGTIVFGSTSGYNAVAVDASNWKGVTHDTRGDVCLFRAEDGGRLPKIKCVFKLTNKGEYDVAGICCNRGSSCVVATLCGFIGFNDGVIANNESSITIREGITMNCGRWGCHARHNGEVSARSVIATGCATDTKYSAESAALCSDRIADLDGREAWVSCGNSFAVRNASRMNCNGTHILGSADETAIIYATAVSVGNFTSMFVDAGVKIDQSQGAMLSVSEYTFRESYVFNDVTNKGIIYK